MIGNHKKLYIRLCLGYLIMAIGTVLPAQSGDLSDQLILNLHSESTQPSIGPDNLYRVKTDHSLYSNRVSAMLVRRQIKLRPVPPLLTDLILMTIALSGSYDGLAGSQSFRLFAANTNNFSSALAIGSNTAAASGSVTFSSLADALPASNRFYWVTVDLAADAGGTINSTISNSSNIDLSGASLSTASVYGGLNSGFDVSLPIQLSAFSAAVDFNGRQSTHGPVYATAPALEITAPLQLNQNYPNPFNPTTVISFELNKSYYVDLSIYNLVGQKVVTLVSSKKPGGRYRVEWDASHVPSGIYLYRVTTDQGFSETRKLILLK